MVKIIHYLDYNYYMGYEVIEFESYEDVQNYIEMYPENEREQFINTYSVAGGTALFVGGVVVGYVVDGVVINLSGQSVGDWVSDGIGALF